MTNVVDLQWERELREYYQKVLVEGHCQCCLRPAEFETANGLPICGECAIHPDSDEGRSVLAMIEAGDL